MKFDFMREHANDFSVEEMARILGVSREGYRKHLRKSPRETSSWLTVQVRAIYEQSGRRFGSPKIFQALRRRGIRCARKSVEKIMKNARIQGVSRKRRAPRTTDSRHNRPVAPNLLQRAFHTSRGNAVWVSDITYIRTRRGWLYLCVVVDLYSRKIVGWSLADHMRTELVVTAFRHAWINRRPPSGLIFHSDRGSQYASQEFCDILKFHGVVQSMSRKGDCWDNAVAESLFGLIKAEIGVDRFEDEHDAYRCMFSYIEIFYNRKRPHSYLNYLSPSEFEGHEAA